jgi:competence protein ComGC
MPIRNTRGSAIAFALVIMTSVSILLVSIVGFVTSQIKNSQQTQGREQALQIAEAGIQFYRWYLAHNTEAKTAAQVKAFWTGTPYGVGTPYTAAYNDPGGVAVGQYELTVTPPPSGSTIVLVESRGWTNRYPALSRTIRVRLRKPSWSEYVVLSNNNIRFGDNTDVKGKIFSNGGVHFDGVADNIVESAVTTYYDNDNDVKDDKPGVWTSWSGEFNTTMGRPVFGAGKQYPVATRDFTAVYSNLGVAKAEAQSGAGRYFDNSGLGRHIILKANGTFDIRTVQSSNSNTHEINNYSGNWANYPIPDGSVIFVEGHVWVEGTINSKRVTIVAANLVSSATKNIYLKNDILYTNHDGQDVLGLIAQNDVEVIQGSEDNLRIEAAVLTQEGRVGRQHYTNSNCHAYACEDHKSTITIFGALATNQRYGFAWTDNTGYTNRVLIFDNNLLYFPPPFFPTGTQYLIDDWQEL